MTRPTKILQLPESNNCREQSSDDGTILNDIGESFSIYLPCCSGHSCKFGFISLYTNFYDRVTGPCLPLPWPNTLCTRLRNDVLCPVSLSWILTRCLSCILQSQEISEKNIAAFNTKVLACSSQNILFQNSNLRLLKGLPCMVQENFSCNMQECKMKCTTCRTSLNSRHRVCHSC